MSRVVRDTFYEVEIFGSRKFKFLKTVGKNSILRQKLNCYLARTRTICVPFGGIPHD